MKFAVYCGSSKGHKPIYTIVVKKLAKILAMHHIDLVYGGGNIGLMGVMADEMLLHNRKVYGVIPEILAEKEVAHYGLTELFVVKNMHQRKAKMFELCDAVIALPGGIGTMEELFEALTWNQIGIHHKPCGLLNINEFYNPFILLLNQMVDDGFLRLQHKDLLKVSSSPEELVKQLITDLK